MKFFLALGVLGVLSISPIQGSLFSKSPFWNGLRTTFALDGVGYGIPIVNRYTQGYAPVPRSDATSDNWELVSDDCTNGGAFNGFRYVKRVNDSYRDSSVSALFDLKGVIAGIQMNILVSEAKADPRNNYKFDEIPMFLKNSLIDGKEVYTLTAYFVDPSTICTSGRDPKALETEGTGTGLYFQNGPNPSSLINIPMKREDAIEQEWDDNCCFPGMGVHNWYKQTAFQDDDCSTILPAFLLYDNDGKLIGFGFQHVGKSYSSRVEYPSDKAVSAIVGSNVSQCLLDRAKSDGVGVTTMHVYLIDSPLSQLCVFRSNKPEQCLL